MITFKEGRAIMEFGHGDIAICSAVLETEENLGFVGFQNGERGEIGRLAPHFKAGVHVNTEVFQVVMGFTSIKSIDVVMEKLGQLKHEMLRKEIEDNA